MSLQPEILARLEKLQAQGDSGRVPYYQALQEANDPYAKLALGVVRQDQMAGRVAYSYALEVAKRYCKPINPQGWINLSIALMKADFQARRDPTAFERGKPSLKWNIIRDYHRLAFQQIAGLPPVAWTAWIPLFIEGEAGDEQLWHRMLTEDFLSVAVDTAWLVASHVALRAGVSRDLAQKVVPALKTAPPVVTGERPADAAYARCMVRLAPFQMQAAAATPGERMASFYLDCLGTGINLVGDGKSGVAGLYGPVSYGTVGDFQRWSMDWPF